MKQNRQNNIVDEIKSRCDIVDVVGRVVSLKKAGSNYKGVCPFHNEKTPSFVVSETKQIYTCFGCGASGDVLSFVEKYYGLDFKGSVEMLAKEYGLSLIHILPMEPLFSSILSGKSPGHVITPVVVS